jgi:hypothetical protein
LKLWRGVKPPTRPAKKPAAVCEDRERTASAQQPAEAAEGAEVDGQAEDEEKQRREEVTEAEDSRSSISARTLVSDSTTPAINAPIASERSSCFAERGHPDEEADRYEEKGLAREPVERDIDRSA